MEAQLKTADGRLVFKVTGETPKALFKEIAGLQEVFEAESSCGCCNGTAIRFQARQVEDFDFYELVCRNNECRARFQFGQAKKGGGLFPKRKDDDGNWLPNRGWEKYVKPGNAASAPSQGNAGPPPPRGIRQDDGRGGW